MEPDSEQKQDDDALPPLPGGEHSAGDASREPASDASPGLPVSDVADDADEDPPPAVGPGDDHSPHGGFSGAAQDEAEAEEAAALPDLGIDDAPPAPKTSEADAADAADAAGGADGAEGSEPAAEPSDAPEPNAPVAEAPPPLDDAPPPVPGGEPSGSGTEPMGEIRIQQPSPQQDPFLGRTFGGYKLVEPIGRGGMGMVYKGHQVSLDRWVAVKLLNKALVDNEEFIKRFQREARAMAQIHHPNIVSVIDFGETEGVWYMVAELVEGTNLARKIREQLMVPASDLLPIAVHCLTGLAHVEKTGVVHRDIKPDNILIDHEGMAKIADFGLAKDLSKEETELTAAGSAMGTPAYMSPEQCMGQKLDGRSDIYALGVTIYYALTGEKPFTGHSSFEIMTKQREHQPPEPHKVNPQVPKEIAELVMKMIAKNPRQRFSNADECREAWLQIGQELGVFASVTRSGEFLFPTDGNGIPGVPKGSLPSATLSYPEASQPPPAVSDFGQNAPPPPPSPPPPSPAASGEGGDDGLALPDLPPEQPGSGSHQRPESERLPRTGSGTDKHRRPTAGYQRPPSTSGVRPPTEAMPPPMPDAGSDIRPPTTASQSSEAMLCQRCGALNRASAEACEKCGGPLQESLGSTRQSRPAQKDDDARTKLPEADQLFQQGKFREAALVYARLAEAEGDRRQRSILRTKEREARGRLEDRLVHETMAQVELYENRRDYAGASKLLQKALNESAYTGVSERLTEVLDRMARKRRGRRIRLAMVVFVFLLIAAAASAWFFRSQLTERFPVLQGLFPSSESTGGAAVGDEDR